LLCEKSQLYNVLCFFGAIYMLRIIIVISILYLLHRFVLKHVMRLVVKKYIENSKRKFYNENPHLKKKETNESID